MKRYFIIMSAISMLAACSTINKSVEENTDHLHSLEKVSQKSIKDVSQGLNTRSVLATNADSPYNINTPFLTDTAIRVKKNALPLVFKNKVSLNTQIMNVRDILELIQGSSSMPVQVNNDVISMLSSASPSTDSGSQNSSGSEPASPSVFGFTLNYEGSFEGMLDVIALKVGVSWKYNDNGIVFFKYDTRHYMLPFVPGTVKTSISSSSGASTSGATSSGSTVGNTTQEYSSTIDYNPFVKIKAVLETMISKEGKVEVDEASSTITVTETPDILAKVETFIKYKTKQMMKQVMVKVVVYRIRMDTTNNNGFSWDVVFKSLNKGWGLNLANQLIAPLTPNITGNVALFNGANVKNLDGTKALFDALSQQGKVSISTSAPVLAMNMQPTPIKKTRDISYVESITTNLDPQTGILVVDEKINTTSEGVSINILPIIMDDNRIIVQVAIDLSTLIEIKTNASGSQSPLTTKDTIIQRVVMKSGQMVAIGGLESSQFKRTETGTGKHTNKLFGGRFDDSSIHDIFVVTITPTLVAL